VNPLRAVRLGLLTAGLAVAVYLTALHYAGSLPACPQGIAVVNCPAVLDSAFATFAGVPVSAWGVIYFLLGWGVIGLGLGRPWRVVHASAGTAAVLVLVYVELFQIGAICLWCTAVHALVVAYWLTVILPADA
jgi:uncharacterized membrane protein